jgi:hypothetical protein
MSVEQLAVALRANALHARYQLFVIRYRVIGGRGFNHLTVLTDNREPAAPPRNR